MKTNLTKFAVISVKRRQKAGSLSPRSSKITVTKEKERRKKIKREKGRKGGEEKKVMVALLYFIIATVTLENAKGPYGDNVMTKPARYIY